jgi:predicted transcriptional regulator
MVGYRSSRREGRPRLKFFMEEKSNSFSFAAKLLKELVSSFAIVIKSSSH